MKLLYPLLALVLGLLMGVPSFAEAPGGRGGPNRERYDLEATDVAGHAAFGLSKLGSGLALMHLSSDETEKVFNARRNLLAAQASPLFPANVGTISPWTNETRAVAVAQAEGEVERLREEVRRIYSYPASIRAEAEERVKSARQQIDLLPVTSRGAESVISANAELAAAEGALASIAGHPETYATIAAEDLVRAERRLALATASLAKLQRVPGVSTSLFESLLRGRPAYMQELRDSLKVALAYPGYSLPGLGLRFLGFVAGGILIADGATEITYLVRGRSDYAPLYHRFVAPPPAVEPGELPR